MAVGTKNKICQNIIFDRKLCSLLVVCTFLLIYYCQRIRMDKIIPIFHSLCYAYIHMLY